MRQRRRLFARTDDVLLAMLTLGGAEDDENENENENDENVEDDDTEDDEEIKNPRIKKLSDENARQRNKNKQLETELEDARGRLKAIEDKDKSELERETGRAKDLEDQLNVTTAELRELKLHNAFLSSNTVTWHDPALALKSLNLEGVQDEKTGDIDAKALKAAVDALAKEKPFLVKSASGGDDSGTRGPSGQPAGSGGRKPSADTRTKLENKYPALRK